MPDNLTLTDLLIEEAERENEYFRNYLRYAKRIKAAARRFVDQGARVYVFGSVLRKNEVPEDIDILIVSSKLGTSGEKNRARRRIFKETDLAYPFEIHLASQEEYRDWYSIFIKEKKEV